MIILLSLSPSEARLFLVNGESVRAVEQEWDLKPTLYPDVISLHLAAQETLCCHQPSWFARACRKEWAGIWLTCPTPLIWKCGYGSPHMATSGSLPLTKPCIDRTRPTCQVSLRGSKTCSNARQR